MNGAEHLDLDVAVAPTDGLHFEAYYRGRFMEFFNPNRAALDREEAVASARWIAWLTTSDAARKVCVQNAVNTAKQAVKTVHSDVKQRGHPKYPHGLHNVAMNLAAAAMDVKHHGRKNDGESTLDSIFNALIDDDPLKKFSEIATGWRRDRSKRSVTEIGRMQGWFDGKVYDAVVEDFRPVVA